MPWTGLTEKMPKGTFDLEFGSTVTETSAAAFSQTFEWVWMDCERNPFTGKVRRYHICISILPHTREREK